MDSLPPTPSAIFTTNLAAAFQPISSTLTALGSVTTYANSAPVRAREIYRIRAQP